MKQSADKKIMLSFDIEFWYDEGWLSKYLKEEPREDYIEESLVPLLEVLEKHSAKATFFITGKVAEKYPQLVKELADKGHEIASHGYSHRPLHKLDAEKFDSELQGSVERIRQITGKRPKGFRAPSFSLNNETKWALPILAKNGFLYDSSIFPVPTLQYGISGVPRHIYRISFADVARLNSQSPLLEVPLTAYTLGFVRIPVAGGMYFRLLPYGLFVKMLKAAHQGGDAILYFHLYELYKNTPIIKEAPWAKRAIKYYGIANNFARFERLLKEFKFDSIESALSHTKK